MPVWTSMASSHRRMPLKTIYLHVRREHTFLPCVPLIRVVDASIEAPPSVLPQRRFCDITGLEVRIIGFSSS